MDQAALKFINDRQIVLREAYEEYRAQFPNSRKVRNGHVVPAACIKDCDTCEEEAKRWAWYQWDERELARIIAQYLEEHDRVYQNMHLAHEREERRRTIQHWIEAFLNDTGSMFRLYRKAGYIVDKAIVALKDALAFRIMHYDDLTWSPLLQPNNRVNCTFSPPSTTDRPTYRRRSQSTISRTSAQSPLPFLEQNTAPLSNDNLSLYNYAPTLSSRSWTETLIELYPPSPRDPNNRPLVIVSVKYLASETSPRPKSRALAAFERLRRHLAHQAEAHGGSSTLVPLQFILLVDLAEGRVSSNMWEMAAWLVREAADQFYGMCSAVFVVNYSWEFGALWSFVKHVLPASARARVLFPSLDELVGHLGADSLPPSLGGTCATPLPYSPPVEIAIQHLQYVRETRQVVHRRSRRKSQITQLNATSSHNPYFGYPALQLQDTLSGPFRFQPARRRKRDLVRTLIWLLFVRWKDRALRMLCAIRNLPRKPPASPSVISLAFLVTITVLLWPSKTQRVRRYFPALEGTRLVAQ